MTDDLGGNSTTPVAGRVSGVLSIEPGVRLYGSAGLEYIVVNRGSQILADGTAFRILADDQPARVEHRRAG